MATRQQISLSFHETFPLSRPAVVQVLDVIPQFNGSGSLETFLRQHTSLGTRYIKAMPRYATGAGLLDFDRRLTEFGRYAAAHDSLLEQHGTQWLMHYFLSAPHGPGPAFWHDLVRTFIFTGNEFAKMQVDRHVAAFVEQTEGRVL